MTSRERFLAAVNHKNPDRIPLDLGVGKSCAIHKGFYEKLLRYFGIKEDIIISSKVAQTAVVSEQVLQKLECDIRCPSPMFGAGSSQSGGYNTGILGLSATKEWEDEQYYYLIDGFGAYTKMPKDGGLYYDMYKAPLEGMDEAEDANYVWPTPPKISPDGYKNAMQYLSEGYPITFVQQFANGFLQHGPRIYGYIDWFAMLSNEEKRVNKFLDKLLELKMQHFDNIFDMYGDNVDVVAENDDLGMQDRPFISMEMWKKYMIPRWKILFEHIRKRSSTVQIEFHSDGATADFIPDLIDAGMQILNPVQISCAGMDPARLKKEFGKDLTFWGAGVDTQFVLPFGTVKEVKEDVKRNIDIRKKDGGFIFSTIHNVQAGVPIENFIAMWETFMENRDY